MARSRSPMDRVFDAVVPRAIGAVDPDELLDRIDVNTLIERLDVEALMARVDVQGLIDRVDVEGIIQRVDVDGLIQRVDVDGIVQRVDVDALMTRVDVNALMARVDMDVLLGAVDVQALMARAGIDKIVAEATTGLAARTLDAGRRQLLGVDAIILNLIDRVLRRPTRVAAPSEARPAGPVARLVGFMIDSVVVSTTFSLMVFLVGTLSELFTGNSFDAARDGGGGWAVGYLGWWFAYLWLGLTVSGRTIGKGLAGTAVVSADGSALSPRAAAVRVVVFPFSFVLGLGFLPALFGKQHRALHDFASGAREVVDWGTRDASLPTPLAAWADARRDDDGAGAPPSV